MTEEYPIDATAFTAMLLSQRKSHLKGGIYHLTQIAMAFNTNRIEGSTLTEEQTRYLYETKTVIGEAHVNDVIETTNSFRAFDAMMDHVGQPLTANTLKEYHQILKSGSLDAEQDWFRVGEWKAIPNEVGGIRTTAPEHVAAEIATLLEHTPTHMTFEDICDFHVAFEKIHPFQDGNGRVGRLVMFGQCLAHNITPFVVLDQQKAFYYRGLAEYDEEPGFLRETFRSFQDWYYERFKDFVVVTHD